VDELLPPERTTPFDAAYTHRSNVLEEGVF
jgi:hypothetical protein